MIAKRVSRLPIWIFHGDADATMPRGAMIATPRGAAHSER
jgi:hypothetical protein